DVDVVTELGTARGPGQQTSVATRHVSRREVQSRQSDTGIVDRAGERVNIRIRGNGFGERPPELHRLESRLFRGGGTLQQRQLGEQCRTVDGVVEGMKHRHILVFASWNLFSAI